MKVLIEHQEFDSKDVCIGVKLNPAEVKEFLGSLSKNIPVLKVKSDIYISKKAKFPQNFQKLTRQHKYNKVIEKSVDKFVKDQYTERFGAVLKSEEGETHPVDIDTNKGDGEAKRKINNLTPE